MKGLHDQTGDRKLFVSEADVLFAWWARTHVSVVKPPPDQAITLFNVVNFRGNAEDVLSNGKLFVGNATAMCSAGLTCEQLLEWPLWQVARQIRASLKRLQTKEGILSIISGQKRYGTPTGDPPGDIGFPLALTNWHVVFSRCCKPIRVQSLIFDRIGTKQEFISWILAVQSCAMGRLQRPKVLDNVARPISILSHISMAK